MTVTWRHLPTPAREIAVAATEAVEAAQAHDGATYDRAVLRLAGADRAGLVLGGMVRLLLEQAHPDGLDGSDIRRVLEHCIRSAETWQPDVDPHVVLVLLAGALGIYDPADGDASPDPVTVARHAPLLVTDLLEVTGIPFAGCLEAAFSEVARTERHDD
ncbi:MULTISPECIES: hypothetical protein [Micromonospora]|uniref:hypothetical protein n=1 Tax=Micromonospora TaxID=1873 RepID=UPI00155F77DF|nr:MULTISPECIES: hypothetical protein [Micromonospora]WFE62754.1 hypothetical protein O7625_05360 [Micromonospora sp. WMMD714]